MLARKLVRPMGLALLLMVLLCAFGFSAQAIESDPIEFTIQVSPTELTEAGDVRVSLRVANTGNADMIDAVTLYDPAGNLVGSFGDGGSYLLTAGAFRTWEGTWKVTDDQLDAGEFAYTIRYHLLDDSGELVEFSRQAVARVKFTGERVKLNISRTITPEVVRSGKTASVVYELYNSGNVDLIDIRVKEKISKTAQTVKSLPAGEKATLTFTSKIGSADLTSSAAITYKAKGTTKTLTEKVEDAAITLAKPNLDIKISTPTAGVNIGEAAKVVVTFTNQGNISYSNVSVKDDKKGEFLTNISIPAGATVVEEKEFILMEPTTFKVTATLPDNTGTTNTMVSNELAIGVFDPEKALLLTLNLTADKQTVSSTPGDLTFKLVVTNNSNIKAEKIAIYHGSTYITEISALEPGASTVITRDVRISQAGQFRFTASLKDSMKNTVTFDSNTLQINYARPTAAPTKMQLVTSSPPPRVTEPPVDPILNSTKGALTIVLFVVGGIFALAFVLFAVSTVIRIINKSKSASAYDHLELAERRNYTDPADEELEDVEVRKEAPRPAAPQAPAARQPVTPPQVSEMGASIRPAQMPASDGEGGYRVSRPAAPANQPAQPVNAPKAPQAPVPQAIPVNRPVQPVNAPQAPQAPVPQAVPAPQAAPAPEQGGEAAPRRRSRGAQRVEDGE
ncbi:MAG: hypothetical protein IJD39_10195 [Clostridia bacterium]|nr:hypothetical protein [Clostridia bacterium]